MVVFNFWNFFAIFLEFSITPRVRMERKDNFYFLFFAAFSCLFWLEMKPMVFLNFVNFFAIFLEFSITHRVVTERNDNFYFSFSHPFANYFGLKWIHIGIFLIFWISLLFFWNFLLRIGQERNGTIIFIFFLSQHFPTYFGLKWGHNDIFNFLNFFAIFFFGIFCYTSDRNGTEL